MLTRPAGLSDDGLVRALADGWGSAVVAIEYQPVGFGSHHWAAVDADGTRWFVTVDELEADAVGRLRAALGTAMALRDCGATFVVVPIATSGGEPLLPLDRRFAVALYPHVEGQSFSWDDFSLPAHRRALLDLVVQLHSAPPAARRGTGTDDFTIAHRRTLETCLVEANAGWAAGPYAEPTAALLVEHGDSIRRMLARYDRTVDETRRGPMRTVLTHGEPHPGNTMLTSTGWVMVDWDTVLLAPPERDLWDLDPGDGSIVGAYTDATGTTLRASALALYRTRWDLAEIAVYVSRFREPHARSLDDEKSWDGLCASVAHVAGSSPSGAPS